MQGITWLIQKAWNKKSPVNMKPPTACVLGIDFGSYKSKMTLAYLTEDSGQERMEINRVPFDGSFDDPERPDTEPETPSNTYSRFEFVALAGYENKKFITGRQSVYNDHIIPLKTMLVHGSGIRRRSTLKLLPGGLYLLELHRTESITLDTQELALLEHFSLLRRQALAEAATNGRTIVKIGLSYPSYICPTEQAEDFDKYVSYYKRLQRKVWGVDIPIGLVSEGQASALYVGEPFTDKQGAFKRQKIWKKLRDLKTEGGLSLLIADGGSSSLNIQLQTAFFNDNGELLGSQSINHSNWVSGVQGGSHMSNFAMQETIIDYVNAHQFPPGQIAALLNDFERQKCNMDWTGTTKNTIQLHGNEPGCTIDITPNLLRRAFEAAFRDGLTLLEKQVRRALEEEKDFAVIFCGGSYYCRGLRILVDELMAKIEWEAESRGICVKHLYLSRHDWDWPCAVSAGVALSICRIPCPIDVFEGSALAIHPLWRSLATTPDVWVGEDTATFLLSKGCGPRRHAKISNDAEKSEELKFALVCDPNYYPTRSPIDNPDKLAGIRQGTGRDTTFKPIPVGSVPKASNAPMSAYDVGFSVPATTLPRGELCFRLSGPDADRLANNIDIKGDPDTHSFDVVLSCYKRNTKGQKTRNKHDKRWLLRVVTDPATKLLVVDEQKELPAWCSVCQRNIRSAADECRTCRNFFRCRDCRITNRISTAHDQSHGWKHIRENFGSGP